MKYVPAWAAALAIAVSACATAPSSVPSASPLTVGASPSILSAPTPTPVASPSLAPSVEPSPSEDNTEDLSSPDPSPSDDVTGSATQGTPIVHAWRPQYSDYTSLEVIVPITNSGSSWVEISGFDSDYTVYDKKGNVVSTGSFSYAYPRFLAPGKTGYLAEQTSTQDVKPKQVGKVEADAYFTDVSEDDTIKLSVSKLRTRSGDFGDGLSTTGTVTNESDENVDSAVIGAFYLDGNGSVLAYSYTNLVDNLRPHKTKGFDTLGGGNPVSRSKVKKVVVYASTAD
jgi:hypothetical protein